MSNVNFSFSSLLKLYKLDISEHNVEYGVFVPFNDFVSDYSSSLYTCALVFFSLPHSNRELKNFEPRGEKKLK